MNSKPRLSTYWVTCADGLENLLQEEIHDLGVSEVERFPGRLVFKGTLEHAYKICMWSRLASRVLMPIHSVEIERTHDARDVAEELYEAAIAFDWSLIFSAQSTFAIRLHTEREIKVNTQFATLRAKDGVVDAFMDAVGRRPSIDTKAPEITLFVQAGKTEHHFCLDLSGDSLHKRGYRRYMTDAPIKENLAAAILMRIGLAKKRPDIFVDPMCGSGTFIIEALMILTDRAPGLVRRFGFNGWQGHDHELWMNIKADAATRHQHALEQTLPAFYAFDADWEAIKATKQNIIAAGFESVLDHIKIEERTLADWPDFHTENKTAVLVTNPPYGERLGEKASNRALYQGLSARLQQYFPNQTVAIIAAQVEQADVLALHDPQTMRLMNGKLPIYIRSGVVKAATVVKPWLETWQPQSFEAIEGAEDFANRLQKNLQSLKKWVVKDQVHCLRVYDADLPDFNLAVDIYGDRLHVQEYAPPKKIDPEKAKKRFNLALAAIRAVTGLNRDVIFIKTRARQEGKNQYSKQSTASKRFIVQEGQAKILVNLTDYLDTGLFLDHRQMRLRIAKEAKGKHFLNLYSYTSTASLHAALGGAASTTSVDLSNTYLNWSKENFVLNGLTVDHADEQHQFFASDCFEWLKEGHEQYDLIFIDPPTFSNSKKFYGTFDVQRDHNSLLKRAMNRLSSGGTLYFSNNYRGFELDEEVQAMFETVEITHETIGPDFKRNQKIHRAWKITHYGV
ncbi:bifunctional 23S rRNA (guanine(2069)-N(7))-methyltransferase RlmK/23S rRNA (guanine(2445)-N(2))-methyltransferase RlmL [Acinetobacter rudis]|uniref:Ribosomal RNA large subunit methyltransferase K/L n=1 Tax=Acinetobacter rudis TaxID=632955 RepID=A0AAW8J6F3_9GAMM|nr:bifunctional 23S rRNA (guanine(2069)-N(7))-methyltransferase RlmK/23S rRNA (guanine(2445)-N(2))-methyltransferase RlmL [Acinetobacter rudis]MDQ8934698.1 bifunctional 23S rRNA (guanine(2069)-N(7))-methyltransferase RlmK/23S rRNA (guanine(2445)-N(2))-methyltransferase RlmL [Acinetobacter rudis]MDQ8951362.1 bifunctional 23S rRNA (guanine(2069)-N(7))-methyltransferase RlmK/23S rRNA (guanine(2445)-N(2))-methyltransferase RlmL [Acinetobacter rudis]MDQ9017221.1 bifunctional 23S rRNA (guanine(2069)-N